MVSPSDPTHEDAGHEGGEREIQQIHIKGGDYVLVPAERYQELLIEEASTPDFLRKYSAAKTTHEIGAIESTGEHKGEIYGGIYPADNKPIWFSAAPRLMDHYAAAAWATEQGGALPTRKQGDYLTTLKGKSGAFTEIFNRGNLFPAGYVWLAEPYSNFRDTAFSQRLSDGDQYDYCRSSELPVLCVVR
jgi:hypothetical protein